MSKANYHNCRGKQIKIALRQSAERFYEEKCGIKHEKRKLRALLILFLILYYGFREYDGMIYFYILSSKTGVIFEKKYDIISRK